MVFLGGIFGGYQFDEEVDDFLYLEAGVFEIKELFVDFVDHHEVEVFFVVFGIGVGRLEGELHEVPQIFLYFLHLKEMLTRTCFLIISLRKSWKRFPSVIWERCHSMQASSSSKEASPA